MQLLQMKKYGCSVYVIESTDIEVAKNAFENLTRTLGELSLLREGEGIDSKFTDSSSETFASPLSSRRGVGGEVMMNIVCLFENNKWTVFILPRKAFRPWQYTAERNKQLLVSPATVEMCGIFITPVEEHFLRITKQDIESIFEQVSL